MYTVGATVHLTNTFADANGPFDPSPAPTVAVTMPDGTPAPGSPFTAVRDDTGIYHYDFTTTASGIHQHYFTGTVGALVGKSTPDVFIVAPTATTALISLVDAREHLNDMDSADDQEILLMIRAATEIINGQAGYTAATTVTEELDSTIDRYGRSVIVLSEPPVMSIQSVTPALADTPPVTVVPANLDARSGIYRSDPATPWFGPQKVTYTAGRATVPENLQAACRIQVQHLWDTQRGVGAVPAGGDEMSDQSTYGVPYRVLELIRLAGMKKIAGVA